MAQVFNPWKDPPSSNTLTGDLASFEINDSESPDAEGAEPEDMAEHGNPMMAEALKVIGQQAELIAKLMASLGK